MKKEQKQLMTKIPAICKAAEYELSAYGKRFVMNNPNASRVEIKLLVLTQASSTSYTRRQKPP
jgi:hypothetical protein